LSVSLTDFDTLSNALTECMKAASQSGRSILIALLSFANT
jgi:hypothetical protein